MMLNPEINPPTEPDTGAEAEAPAGADAPAEVDAPLDVDAPAEVDAPLDVDAPLEVDDPAEAEAPAEVDAPLEVDDPAEADAPAEVDVPLEIDGPLVVDAPLEVDGPLVVDAPLEVDAPANDVAPAKNDTSAGADAAAKVDASADVDTTAFERLAEAYYGGGFYLSSLETYTKIMEMNPEKRLFSLTRIGCIHSMMGKFEEAIATFETVFKTDPNFLSALKGISETLIKDARAKSENKRYYLARHSTQLAVDHLIRALTITKKYPAFWKLLAGALLLLTKLPDDYCFVELTFNEEDDIGIAGYVCMKKNIYKLSEYCYWCGRSVMSPHFKRIRGRELTAEIFAEEETDDDLRNYSPAALGITYTEMIEDLFKDKSEHSVQGI